MSDHDDLIARAEASLKGVTPGPWRVGPVDDCRVEDGDGNEVAMIDGDYNQPDTWPLMESNARFIAASRQNVPDLIAALRAERAARERAEAMVAAAYRDEADQVAMTMRHTILARTPADASAALARIRQEAADEARELKPCPFCGSGPAVTRQNASFSGVELLHDYSRGVWWVRCGTCGAQGPSERDSEAAITAWNTRADLPPTLAEALALPEVQALVEALREISDMRPHHAGQTRNECLMQQIAGDALRKVEWK